MPDQALTINEVAVLLKLAEKDVYSMAQAGEISSFQDSAPAERQACRTRPVARHAAARWGQEWQ